MGGSLRLEQDGGSTFVLFLPLAPGEPFSRENDAMLAAQTTTSTDGGS
jgi:hypothetical protein